MLRKQPKLKGTISSVQGR